MGARRPPGPPAPTGNARIEKAPEPTKPAAQPTAVPAAKVAWPEKGKSITMIVPWAAGSVNDVLTRLVVTYLEKDLGTSIQVENKPGASTQVGMTDLVKAKPDGYTLAFNSMPTTILVYADPDRKAGFARKDFEPLAVMVQEPMALSAKADGPHKTTKDLIDAARAAPDKVKVGDAGFLVPSHMGVMRLGKAAGVKLASVHFNGDVEALTAVLGGHIDAVMGGPTTALAQAKQGAVRILGITDREELKALPGVQPLPGQGYDVVMLISRGYVAPGGTPKEIVNLLSAAFKRVAQNEDFAKKAAEAGLTVRFSDAAQYAAQWDEQEKFVSPMLQEAKAEQKN